VGNILKAILIFLPEKVSKIIKYRRFKKNKCTIGDYCDIDNKTILQYNVLVANHASLRDCEIDNYSSIGRYSKLAYVHMGKFCSISWDVTIGAIEHPYDRISTHAFPYTSRAGHFVNHEKHFKTITWVGNDVWIGCNSVIISGVKIGDGAIIGASAVVTKDVPPYAIVVGIPAKIIGYRFDSKTVEKLQEIKWWDLDRDEIKKNINIFQQKLDDSIINCLEELKYSKE